MLYSVCIGEVQFFPSPDGLLHQVTSVSHLQVQAICAPSIQVASSNILKLWVLLATLINSTWIRYSHVIYLWPVRGNP